MTSVLLLLLLLVMLGLFPWPGGPVQVGYYPSGGLALLLLVLVILALAGRL